ncbi:MAG TPA: hypothetical protein VKP30_27475, partial [Polyangiaceae bacterium]|nr:hypothetical protein [Polyangiaceae bacterium]
ADVELNSANYAFALDSSGSGTAAGTTRVDLPSVDLPSIAQHESGHVLGFEDLPRASAQDSMTMFPQYPGGIGWRDLDADAIAAVCDAYPPTDSPDLSCVADPPHGFTPECVPDDGCTITSRRLGFATERWWGVDCLFVLGLFPAWRKRFRRARGLPLPRVPDQDQPNRAR